MKIFEKDSKINFVDENNVFLGYDLRQDCCEHADWFIADTPQEKPPETERNGIPDLCGFVFDPVYFKNVEGGERFDMGGMSIFRIVNKDAEKYIHIFNCQNGYYGHGFEFIIGGKKALEGVL